MHLPLLSPLLHIPLPTALLHDTMPHQLHMQTLQEADQSVSPSVSQSVNSTESKLAAKASGLHWVSESADEIGARSLEQDECVEGLRAECARLQEGLVSANKLLDCARLL